MGRLQGICTALVLLAVAAACGQGENGTPSTRSLAPTGSPVPVVVDTDLAVDDLVALALLLVSPDADVVAVTVSGTGEVHCPQGLEVVRGLLALTGDEGIPVACGRAEPLVGGREFPAEWREAADGGWGLELPSATAPVVERTAVELLRDASRVTPLTVLTLGPLTNLADALRVDPDLAARLARVVVMGGAVDVPGNASEDGVPTDAEWNLSIDPVAADEVLGSGVPIVLVALDATNEAPISGDFLELLRVNAHTEVASLVRTALVNNTLVYTGDAYFWDPLAAAVVLDPRVVTTEQANLEVRTGDGPDRGTTRRGRDGHPVTLAVGADLDALEELLVRTLDGLDDEAALVAPPAVVADVAIRFDGATCAADAPSVVEPGRIRFTFVSDATTWSAVVVHPTGERTLEEVLAWIEANPRSRVPGIDLPVAFVGPGAVTFTDAEPSALWLACASEAGAILVAATVTVG